MSVAFAVFHAYHANMAMITVAIAENIAQIADTIEEITTQSTT